MAELLAPAGNLETLDAAIGEGADAVYLGLKSFNARLRASNFAWNQFEAAVDAVHRLGKKIFVTVNTVCEENETERLYRFLAYLERVGPDGIIVQDMGVIRMVQEFFPRLRLHASTQLNTASSRAVNLLGKNGVKRIVLARETSLAEIREIKTHTSAEIEVFVHGALCISESGLCLFSSFLGGKSANRGMCTQACRRMYAVADDGGTQSGYFFSPNDLQLIDKIPELVTAGVDSFKIEGRMKSAEYVGSVTAAYRYVLDHWQEDKKGAIATGKRILSTDFGRQKTHFWYDFAPPKDIAVAENTLNPSQAGGTGIYLGKIAAVKSGMASLSGGTYEPEEGDSIRLHRKDDSGRESHKVRQVHTDGGVLWIDIPEGFSVGDDVYLLQTRTMSKRYRRILPNDLHAFRTHPDNRDLPILDLTPVGKRELAAFPEGIYVQVSTVRDLHAVLTEHPVRIILELNSETIADLTRKKAALPLPKSCVFLSLEPFCPQVAEDELADVVAFLVADGYKNWIVNNSAHIAMLRGTDVFMAAGPYLYTFNRWAASWLENQNISAFIPPLENSRENLEATFERNIRSRVLVTLFAYPALFRMRFRLPESYDFTYFSDKGGAVFKAFSTPDAAFVLPEQPFSIIDAASHLRKIGFARFLVDLSKTRVDKKDFKLILSALYKGAPLTETHRFNWKEGFYSPEKIENRKGK